MKKIFFVIPVYKSEKYLKRCVDSVLAQKYPEVGIVLVDDGSPDSCPQLCDDFAAEHDNIEVIHKPNGGLSDARNAGLDYVRQNADGDDYLTFLDSDDFVSPDFASTLIDLCERENCGLAQCGYEKGPDDTFTTIQTHTGTEIRSWQETLLGYELKSQSCAKIYRVSAFCGLEFPKGRINEDEFVTYRAVYAAGRVAVTDNRLYYYYQHVTSIMDNVAKKLKDNPRRYDFLDAYAQRIQFFEAKNLPDQVLKTREKICTDIILRYCEQMYLAKEDRDTDATNGTYMKIYRDNFRSMIKRRGIPFKRAAMYISFFVAPWSAVVMGRIFTLRK